MKQYTAGQFAELSGVSARTIRYYDQRGLLPPSGYSEGGYRLYGQEALIRMQQIVMLKFAGLSLDEVQTVLLMEKQRDLRDILEDQRQRLVQKRDQLDEMIQLLDRTLEQGQPQNLDCLVESMQRIRRANHSVRTYQFCKEHGCRQLYPWEFDQLELEENMRVLDLGCGIGLLWRQNWERIPLGVCVTMVDILPGVLAHFQEFYESRETSPVHMELVNADAETMEFPETYDRIVMAYVWDHLKNPEALLETLAGRLDSRGELMVIGGTSWVLHEFDELYRVYSGESCLKERAEAEQARTDEMERALFARFPRVEKLPFENVLTFSAPLELYRFLMDSYHELKEALAREGIGFVNFLRNYMEEKGEIEFHSRVTLYRCQKKGEKTP